MWQTGHITRQFGFFAYESRSGLNHNPRWAWTKEAISHARAELLNAEEIRRGANKQPAQHDVLELLPWYATGRLSNRHAERVEQALAGDRKLAQRYELARRELAETTRLNETLGAPSARAMKKLFAAINADQARAPRPRPRPISRARFLAYPRDSALEKLTSIK